MELNYTKVGDYLLPNLILKPRKQQNLNKYGVYTSISFTAHKKNYKTFKKVVSIAKKAKANKVWTDRLIPIGGAKELVKISLNQKEIKILKFNSYTNL